MWERDASLPERIANAWESAGKKFNLGDIRAGLGKLMFELHQWGNAVWECLRKGVFSVRSAYKLAFEEKIRTMTCATSRAPDGRRAVWTAVWRCPAPPKVRMFAWRLATDSLATMENKYIRHLEISDVCVICGVERENTYHTFCRCPMAVALWNAMRDSWPLPELASVQNTGSEWLLRLLDQHTETIQMVILMTFWQIWHCRNEVTHFKPAPSIEASRRFLNSYMESLLCIKQHPSGDIVKGKMVLSCDSRPSLCKVTPATAATNSCAAEQWSKPPAGGRS